MNNTLKGMTIGFLKKSRNAFSYVAKLANSRTRGDENE